MKISDAVPARSRKSKELGEAVIAIVTFELGGGRSNSDNQLGI
jgi:hypothetical protein